MIPLPPHFCRLLFDYHQPEVFHFQGLPRLRLAPSGQACLGRHRHDSYWHGPLFHFASITTNYLPVPPALVNALPPAAHASPREQSEHKYITEFHFDDRCDGDTDFDFVEGRHDWRHPAVLIIAPAVQ